MKPRSKDSLQSVTWVVEVASQVLFSNTASVHYELFVGRDERSLELGFAAIAGKGYGEPGQVHDHTTPKHHGKKPQVQPKGVYSRAIEMLVEDVYALWNKPPLPEWKDEDGLESEDRSKDESHGDRQNGATQRERKPKKVHLVMLTHGLHSNVSADMLYLKESIDATAKQARQAARKKKKAERSRRSSGSSATIQDTSENDGPNISSHAQGSGGQEQLSDDEDDEDSGDEEVIVRGFFGNAIRTEKGIQYLGKRLAKFVLTTTYPDQPFLPNSKSMTRTLTEALTSGPPKPSRYSPASQAGNNPHKEYKQGDKLPYTFTSISFIGHSLGGLVQMYAIAYIHKHAPEFFNQIKPVNFVAMATPLLGLSNENPMYVKFALDFGLVGRTGQDLGLTWRAPTIARSGWSAMIAGLGGSNNEKNEKNEHHDDPRAKPLLRILPTGPAHQVLKMFRNRTVYSNVVNDGIVPLRTSCLLFLDWRGLDRVENARRQNGLISTVASFGWAELTGSNTMSHKPPARMSPPESDASDDETAASEGTDNGHHDSTVVPQPERDATRKDSINSHQDPEPQQLLGPRREVRGGHTRGNSVDDDSETSKHSGNPFTEILSFFKPGSPKSSSTKGQKLPHKVQRTYKRAQTIKPGEEASDYDGSDAGEGVDHAKHSKRPAATRGDSTGDDPVTGPPPRTSVFEAAGDIINPPIPRQSWIIDPSTRDRTIFHDRIYHPDDIPPPPPKKPGILSRSFSSDSGFGPPGSPGSKSDSQSDPGGMKVEERIARAYHHDLSWRKVLVRLEPDAHNNMVVRRMFANAYGWDVIKHVCDTHFADTISAKTRDEDESSKDRAKAANEAAGETGEQVHGQTDGPVDGGGLHRTRSELSETADKVRDLNTPAKGAATLSSSGGVDKPRDNSVTGKGRSNSAQWSDSVFDNNDDDSDSDEDQEISAFETLQRRFWAPAQRPHRRHSHDNLAQQARGASHLSIQTNNRRSEVPSGTSDTEINAFLTQSPREMHRGLGIMSSPTTYENGEYDIVQPLQIHRTRPSDVVPGRFTGTSNTAELGIAKPLEAYIRPQAYQQGQHGVGNISETVARLQRPDESH